LTSESKCVIFVFTFKNIKTMKTLTTITGKEIKVGSNKSTRTFTLIVNGIKYRTTKMTQEEFNSCLHNTGNDWNQFLKSDDYYVSAKKFINK